MTQGDRALAVLVAAVAGLGVLAGTGPVRAQGPASALDVRLNGYAEWQKDGALVVDGQRVRADAATRWKGKYSTLAAVPLGEEVRVRGTRTPSGVVLAGEIDVRPNGTAMFEPQVQEGTTELEGLWLRNGAAFEADANGRKIVIGEIEEQGPRVDRVRRLVRRLAPPYVDQSRLRVYVIDNEEWNAMAMGNGAIWVFRGIIDDMNDTELATVVGHELAHYTHEHSRRQMRKGLWMQMGALATLAAAEAIDNNGLRTLAQVSTMLGFSAWRNGYGRDHEDQADRVGMRYAYEGGFDVTAAPRVWQRFLDKYGDTNQVANFFFSDHSTASARRRNLEEELRYNYTH